MMIEKISILHISDNREKGGRSVFTVDLISSMNKSVDNYLLTTDHSEIERLAVIYKIRFESFNKLTVGKILDTATNINARILHFHDSNVYHLIPSLRSKKKEQFKVISNIHRYDWNKCHFPLENRLKSSDRLIACSNIERNLIRDIPYPVDQVLVLHKPVLLKRFNQGISPHHILTSFNVPPEIMLIGTVTRFDDSLNYTLWADIIDLLIDKYNDLEFLIVGDGPRKKDFESILKNRGLNKKVMFTGYRDDIPQILAAIDIYFHPTFEDRISYSVIEALAVGKPVISPHLSSMREYFLNGRNGLFYDIENPEEVCALFSNFKERPTLQADVVRSNILDAAEKMTVERTAAKMIEIYRSVL